MQKKKNLLGHPIIKSIAVYAQCYGSIKWAPLVFCSGLLSASNWTLPIPYILRLMRSEFISFFFCYSPSSFPGEYGPLLAYLWCCCCCNYWQHIFAADYLLYKFPGSYLVVFWFCSFCVMETTYIFLCTSFQRSCKSTQFWSFGFNDIVENIQSSLY